MEEEREREQARERERARTREPQRELITLSNCKKIELQTMWQIEEKDKNGL